MLLFIVLHWNHIMGLSYSKPTLLMETVAKPAILLASTICIAGFKIPVATGNNKKLRANNPH